MDKIPVQWQFRRTSIMPVIDIIGECDTKNAQPVMFSEIVDFIKNAEQFNGRPYLMPDYNSKKEICVCCSLIFPTETDLNNFLEFIKSKQ